MKTCLMKTNRYEISLVNHGFLSLDGGAMFGSVPRPLWERKAHPDAKHRITLATRSLLIRGEGICALVDVGCGNKWSEKEQTIFNFTPIIEQTPAFHPEEITDLIITHLHFDHAGGLTYYNADGVLQPSYPQATIWLQHDNYETAIDPNIRERASYLPEHIAQLKQGTLKLVQGTCEILPDIWVHQSDGHTRGLQYIEIRGGDAPILYPSDLIPTSHHLPLPYHMGYDMCAQTLLEEKAPFLERALQEKALIVFEHDPEIAVATIEKKESGHYGIAMIVERETNPGTDGKIGG